MKQEQKTHVSADALIQLLKGARSIRWQLALGVVMSLVLVVCALVIPTQMGASFKMARAMHSRCFCPPERFLPDCCSGCSSRSGRELRKGVSCAMSAASRISASSAPGRPISMLCRMVPE